MSHHTRTTEPEVTPAPTFEDYWQNLAIWRRIQREAEQIAGIRPLTMGQSIQLLARLQRLHHLARGGR